MSFHLKVVTPSEIFFEGDVTSVVAPGTIGYFGILKNHAPFVTTIEKGNLTWKDSTGAVTTHKVQGGFFEVSGNKAVLLIDKIQQNV